MNTLLRGKAGKRERPAFGSSQVTNELSCSASTARCSHVIYETYGRYADGNFDEIGPAADPKLALCKTLASRTLASN